MDDDDDGREFQGWAWDDPAGLGPQFDNFWDDPHLIIPEYK